MFHLMRACGLLAVPALMAVPVSAQPDRPVAAGPARQATPLPNGPAVDGYQRFRDEKPISWKEANDTVGRIGGWRAYAREAQEGQSAGRQPPAAGPADPQPAHGKH